ncbi:hypothetical protein J5N97_000505 [Dioscorea zingiberensis]|uniref:Retrotransposon Copia-like N-terminal domain-containing protein n=1 Tax=Dioscorea zingiberensis TaxID=325984 RepID=A0A9D5BSF5_9LILI|nr:hypothetical protein J5N97_000505 [Dioscorea zingiberensis]
MATNSSTNITSTTVPASSSGILPTPAFNHLINVKLSRENYLLWKAQLLPYLRSQRLLGYVDGSQERPVATITQANAEGASVVPNPEYVTWYQQDQLVLRALLSSLTEEVLSHVIFMSTSREVWLALEAMFSSGSRARTMQIRLQLSTLQKKDLRVTDYFRKVKNLADTLCAIGTPLRDDEVISYILAGLGPEFDSLVTSVTTRVDPMSLSDLYAHMLSFELRLEHNNSVYQVPSANQANRNSYRTNGKGGERAAAQM